MITVKHIDTEIGPALRLEIEGEVTNRAEALITLYKELNPLFGYSLSHCATVLTSLQHIGSFNILKD